MSEEKKSYGETYGLDIGTMNLVSARIGEANTIKVNTLRNVFLEVDKDSSKNMDLSNISHVNLEDKIFFLSEDAYNFANIFGTKINRPMAKGLISPQEIDSIDILALMIRKLIGTSKNGKCCFSIPADPIDSNNNIIYHQNVFSKIVTSLGFEAEPVNEATAIVYRECQTTSFSGIGISFGAGMTNVAVVYRSIPAATFSISRGGDWIDENAAIATGTISNRVTRIKETSLDLKDLTIGNKKDKRIKEALVYYYDDLVKYTIKNITNAIKNITIELPESFPVIISGGTSLVNGFDELIGKSFKQYEFPFDISEIRFAENPLTAVAEGCLIKAMK